MTSLQINMLGTSFSIKANEDEEYLKKLLKYYTQITDLITKNGTLNNQQISILAGIMLCDELYKEKSSKALEKSKAEKKLKKKEDFELILESKIKQLIEKLDISLTDSE